MFDPLDMKYGGFLITLTFRSPHWAQRWSDGAAVDDKHVQLKVRPALLCQRRTMSVDMEATDTSTSRVVIGPCAFAKDICRNPIGPHISSNSRVFLSLRGMGRNKGYNYSISNSISSIRKRVGWDFQWCLDTKDREGRSEYHQHGANPKSFPLAEKLGGCLANPKTQDVGLRHTILLDGPNAANLYPLDPKTSPHTTT